MQKLILLLLAFFARSIIAIHKPRVIGITGTVGKTTLSAHVYGYLTRVLHHENIGYSRDHYNGEYGLPLTIIGAKTGGKNPFKWIWVFMVAIFRLLRPYPGYLVLEYGIDHPGEMDFLLSIAIPDIAIITEVSPNHLEQFGTFDLYKKEKLKMMHESRKLIIHDTLRDSIDREAIYFGSGGMSDIDLSHVELDHSGTSAKVHFRHKSYDIHMRALGAFHIVNLLPLYAISEIYELPATVIAEYASSVHGEPGRSRIFEGIGNSTIIDGSYNCGYQSISAGVSSMQNFLGTHNIVFLLGDMRELGGQTDILHKKLANNILDSFPHGSDGISFFLVGPYMRDYVFPLLRNHYPTRSFLSSREAGLSITQLLQKKQTKHTMIYVKGSQNTIFLEEAIELCLHNSDDVMYLCRQGPEWKRKKEVFFSSLL